MDNSTQYDSDERLFRYIDGEMEEEEKRSLEADLQQDAALLEKLTSLRMAREAILQYGLKNQVASIHQDIMKERNTPVVPMRQNNFRRWAIGVAATVLFAWASIQAYQYFSLTPERVYAQQFSSYELPVLRSEEQKNTSEMETAYRDKDFNRVVRLCKLNSGFTARENFLCGMAEMELGNFSDAIRSFNQIIQYNTANATRDYLDEAEYNLALAYLKNGEFNRSLELLRSIHSDPKHVYHRKVSNRLIKQVQRLS